MDYQKDTKVDPDASSSTFTGKKDVIDLTSYYVSYSITEPKMSNTTTMTISLPRQTVDKTIEGYDPNRIPLSVFTSKPSNPLEWSLASTESLFSISLGKSSGSDWPYKSMEAENSNAITIDSQNEADFIELKFNKKAGVDTSKPTMQADNFPADTTTTTTLETVDEKTGEDEERTSPRVTNECLVLEPIREHEINEEVSPVDRSGISYNNPPNTIEIENVEENTQPEIVDHATNASLGGWFSCFRCCFSWKLACY